MPVNSYIDHPLSWAPPTNIKKKRPVYLSIAAKLEDDILSKRLAEGTKLPPQRELADFLDIDFTTITRAYDICREKGLIHGITGRGTFVSPSDMHLSATTTIDCSVVQAFPEIGAQEIADAARDILSRPSASSIFSYRNRDGSPSSLSAALKWLNLHGVTTDENRIAVFPGSQGALSAALLALFHPGDSIAADEFTYANFISLSRLAHLKIVPIASDESGMRPDALEEAALKHSLKGIFLMPRDANPTGITLSEERKSELAKIIKEKDIILIEDDAKLTLPKKGERPIFSRIPERTIYIAGSTRNIAPGIRATFMTFPQCHKMRILSALHHLTIKAGALDTEILSELITSKRAVKILAMKATKACEANEIFNSVFEGAPTISSTALFRTIPLPGTSGHGQRIEADLRAAGVAVCHSDRFSVKAGQSDSFLRVSISSTKTLSQLRKGLKTINKYIRAKGSL
jgi:DNA-binding transcriptional MocR family regulator